jgi:hypothetical protein
LSLKYLYYRYEPPCLVPHLSLLSWSFSSSLVRTTLQRTPWFSCTQPERKGELMSFPVAIVDHKGQWELREEFLFPPEGGPDLEIHSVFSCPMGSNTQKSECLKVLESFSPLHSPIPHPCSLESHSQINFLYWGTSLQHIYKLSVAVLKHFWGTQSFFIALE